ncbi:kynurenine--oxoglutarate transaminase 3 isoform X4 [Carcharodon carcharias]|uniref:kynurenine--oxoglutarate transaminase 3 isoform X4 n=1 Tax=Carcharodon carcharias TaxID=13397 RepID=UPI001B7E2318|nr:kynurenine--oxoglutarate transaminase 3 isoform X4 [Carcharodon carcharias]
MRQTGMQLACQLRCIKTTQNLLCSSSTQKFSTSVMTLFRHKNAKRIEGLDKNVWIEFTKLAAEPDVVNLGQGFPDLPPPPYIREALADAAVGENFMLNQYTRGFVQENVEQGVSYSGDWKLNEEELASKFNSRTKAIIINTPNNPLGKIFKMEELKIIADLCIKHDVLCISDEVYEWLVYSGHKHIKIATLPGMWERTITIGSAGKTFSVTGWKLGWSIGPEHLIKHLQTVQQNTIYTCCTPVQEAVAQGIRKEHVRLKEQECYFLSLPCELEVKRNRMVKFLCAAGMRPVIPEGGYFMIADISALNVDLSKMEGNEPYDNLFVKWMIKNKRLAAIPMSSFVSDQSKSNFEKYIRFCFIKQDSTLDSAEAILRGWK